MVLELAADIQVGVRGRGVRQAGATRTWFWSWQQTSRWGCGTAVRRGVSSP